MDSLFLSDSSWELEAAEAGVNGAEDVTDQWSKDHQCRNNDNSYQNEDQRVLYKALSFFFRGK